MLRFLTLDTPCDAVCAPVRLAQRCGGPVRVLAQTRWGGRGVLHEEAGLAAKDGIFVRRAFELYFSCFFVSASLVVLRGAIE